MTHQSIAISATGAVLAFAVFVWPTTYRYDHMNLDGTVLPVRIHRVSGKTEVLYPSGWEVAVSNADEFQVVPEEEIGKLDCTADLFGGKLTCKVYNGTNWRIREIVVHVKVFSQNNWAELLGEPTDDSVNESPVIDWRAAFNEGELADDSDSGPPILNRDYRLSNEYFTDPLEAGIFNGYVDFDLHPGQRFEWSIKSAKGEPM